MHVRELTLHYMTRLDIALGRAEMLQLLAAGLEDHEPKTSRAIMAIACDIEQECLATMDEVAEINEAIKIGSVDGTVDLLQVYGTLAVKG